MRSDIIKRATDYWSEKRDGRRMPTRPSIDPIDLADLLPNLVVAESIDGGKDYMHRIAGAEAEKLLGADMHGTRLSRLKNSKTALASWRNGLDLARTLKAPHFTTFESEIGVMPIRAVFLPLSRGETDDQAEFVLTALTDIAVTNEDADWTKRSQPAVAFPINSRP